MSLTKTISENLKAIAEAIRWQKSEFEQVVTHTEKQAYEEPYSTWKHSSNLTLGWGNNGTGGYVAEDWTYDKFKQPEITAVKYHIVYDLLQGDKLIIQWLESDFTLEYEGAGDVTVGPYPNQNYRIALQKTSTGDSTFKGFEIEFMPYKADGTRYTTTKYKYVTIVDDKIEPPKYTPKQMPEEILNLDKNRRVIGYITLENIPDELFNEAFTTDGLIVRAHYSDGTTRQVYGWTCNIELGANLLEDTPHEVVITYTERGLTRTAKYTVTIRNFNLVSFANGPDRDIKDMILAADNNRINLNDYWSIGDERWWYNFDASDPNDPNYDENDNYIGYPEFEFWKVAVLVDDLSKTPSNIYNYPLVNKTLLGRGSFIVNFTTPSMKEVVLDLPWITTADEKTPYQQSVLPELMNEWYVYTVQWQKDIIKKISIYSGYPGTAPDFDPNYDFGGKFTEGYYFVPALCELRDDPPYQSYTELKHLHMWEYFNGLQQSDFIRNDFLQEYPVTWFTRSNIRMGQRPVQGVASNSSTAFHYFDTTGQNNVGGGVIAGRICPAFVI